MMSAIKIDQRPPTMEHVLSAVSEPNGNVQSKGYIFGLLAPYTS
jgi:hypothetical protein